MNGYEEGVEDAIEFVLEWGEKHPHAKTALQVDGRIHERNTTTR